jgi:hypothetical protein
MSFFEKIQQYGEEIKSKKVSGIEYMHMLHLRSELHKDYEKLTREERQQLALYDLELLKRAFEIKERLEEVFDFSLCDKPIQEWWWHLDKLIDGNIHLKAIGIRSYE